MALLNQEYSSLMDLQKLMHKDKPITKCAELMVRESKVLQIFPMIQADADDGQPVLLSTALPRPTWVGHNKGVRPTKGAQDSYLETMARAEARFAIAKSLTERNGGPRQKERLVTDHVLGITNEVVSSFWYSSTLVDPEKFAGLTPRLDSLTGRYAKQIIDHDNSAAGQNCASIWLVVPGPDSVHFIYPPTTAAQQSAAQARGEDLGVTAGIDYTKLPDDYEDIEGNGTKVLCERGHFVYRVGVAVQNHRHVVRVGNIDLNTVAPDSRSILDALEDAQHRLPDSVRSKAVIFMNADVRRFLGRQANYNRTPILEGQVAGHVFEKWGSMPLVLDENLLSTESPIGA